MVHVFSVKLFQRDFKWVGWAVDLWILEITRADICYVVERSL
jgi:hypothetical protein